MEILNWEKYNPRKDYKKPWWFAVSNTITTDEIFSEFLDAEFKAWIHILCTASVQNTNRPKVFVKHAERVASVTRKTLVSTIEKLRVLQVIQVPESICTESVRDLYATQQYRTEQYTTEQDTPVVQSTPVPTSSDGLIRLLSDEVKSLYLDAPEYVSREAVKAWAWCENNSRKRPKSPKGFRQFFSGWLERGWDRHRKNLPSQEPRGSGLMRGE